MKTFSIIFSLFFICCCEQKQTYDSLLSFSTEIDKDKTFYSSCILFSNEKGSCNIVVPFRCILNNEVIQKKISTQKESHTRQADYPWDIYSNDENCLEEDIAVKISPECRYYTHPLLPLRYLSWHCTDYQINHDTKKLERIHGYLEIAPKNLCDMTAIESDIVAHIYKRYQLLIRAQPNRFPEEFDPRDVYGLENYNYPKRDFKLLIVNIIFNVDKNGNLSLEDSVEIKGPIYRSDIHPSETESFSHFQQAHFSGTTIKISCIH